LHHVATPTGFLASGGSSAAISMLPFEMFNTVLVRAAKGKAFASDAVMRSVVKKECYLRTCIEAQNGATPSCYRAVVEPFTKGRGRRRILVTLQYLQVLWAKELGAGAHFQCREFVNTFVRMYLGSVMFRTQPY
jgi:hypothetical protein